MHAPALRPFAALSSKVSPSTLLRVQANPTGDADHPGLSIAWGNCGHVFHLDCIQRWLKTRGTCPLCAKVRSAFCRWGSRAVQGHRLAGFYRAATGQDACIAKPDASLEEAFDSIWCTVYVSGARAAIVLCSLGAVSCTQDWEFSKVRRQPVWHNRTLRIPKSYSRHNIYEHSMDWQSQRHTGRCDWGPPPGFVYRRFVGLGPQGTVHVQLDST